MKTMVGRAPNFLEEAESLCKGDFEQAAPFRASANNDRKSKRMREVINAPLQLCSFLSSQCKLRS